MLGRFVGDKMPNSLNREGFVLDTKFLHNLLKSLFI